MARSLDFDPALFALHGTAPELAGYLDRVHPQKLASIIAEMERAFHAPEVDERRKHSAQHQALARCELVRTIYTTNFEHHIEGALRDANRKAAVLARLEDFARPVDQEACQIVKFHGDLAFPETVVLTESHFFERFRLEAAPDQRLRSDLLSNVFLFLGYKFGDINTRFIWWRMARLRRENRLPGAPAAPEDRCYFASFGAGLVQPDLLDEWNIDVIELDPGDPSKSVVELLDLVSS
jgi:hypothetical protein